MLKSKIYFSFFSRVFLTSVIFLSGFVITSSSQTPDFGLWSEVGVSKKINDSLTVFLDAEFRLRNELKTVNKFQTSLGFDYKLSDLFKVGASYTLINYYHPGNKSHDYKNYWETRHRLNLFGEGEYEIKRITITLKERFQATYRMLDSVSTANVNPKFIARTKLMVSYNIRKTPIEPYATCELFHVLNGPDKMTIEELRLGGGVKYKVSKKLSVKAGYIYSNEIDPEEGELANVATIGISFKI